jgi:hypothetical protein
MSQFRFEVLTPLADGRELSQGYITINNARARDITEFESRLESDRPITLADGGDTVIRIDYFIE